MTDFKTLLEKQVKAATAATSPVATKGHAKTPPKKAEKGPPREAREPAAPAEEAEQENGAEANLAPPSGQGRGRKAVSRDSSNLNRVTVNLFDSDRRALATIKEKLTTAGHDFTSRSDSMKIALRLASKASVDELSAMYLLVKAEDGRHR